MIGARALRSFFEAPPGSTRTERHNFHYAYREAALIGVINAGGTFLPVFLVRLGASTVQVGMLTALPALTAVLLAIPIGAFLQSRRNIIPWYSRGRIGGQAAFGAAALASLLLPAAYVVPGILVLWGAATLFSTTTNVAFNVVMNALSGTRGRFELMSRRWSIVGFATAASLAVVGWLLGRVRFPLNFQLVFAGLSLLGLWAYTFGSKLIVPDHPRVERSPDGPALRARVREMAGRVRGQPAFIGFEARRVVYAMGTTMALPLIPLYYVHVLHASNGWIGLIGTAQALMLLVGYATWRRQSRLRGARFVLTIATAGAALYPAALGVTHGVEIALLLGGVGAVFTSGVNLAIFDRLMTTVPEGYGVTFNSIDTTVANVAGLSAPLLGAFIADRIGLGGALAVTSLIGLCGAALFALDRTPAPPAGVPEPAGAAASGG